MDSARFVCSSFTGRQPSYYNSVRGRPMASLVNIRYGRRRDSGTGPAYTYQCEHTRLSIGHGVLVNDVTTDATLYVTGRARPSTIRIRQQDDPNTQTVRRRSCAPGQSGVVSPPRDRAYVRTYVRTGRHVSQNPRRIRSFPFRRMRFDVVR